MRHNSMTRKILLLSKIFLWHLKASSSAGFAYVFHSSTGLGVVFVAVNDATETEFLDLIATFFFITRQPWLLTSVFLKNSASLVAPTEHFRISF